MDTLKIVTTSDAVRNPQDENSLMSFPREAEEAETTEHVLSVEEFTQVVKIL